MKELEQTAPIHLEPAEPSNRVPRHEHRVRTFSRDYALITDVGDRYAVGFADVERIVRSIARQFAVPAPDLTFNARRRSDTGQCWPPRWHAITTNGEERVAAWESHYRRPYPLDGQIRLGRMTMLRTLAHELGHHLVHVLEPVRTPAHGKVWVGRFDDALEAIVDSVPVPAIR